MPEKHYIEGWEKLPPAWRVAITHYVKNGFKNKTAAYCAAYDDARPEDVSVRVAAHRLFEKAEVQAVIEEAMNASGLSDEFLLLSLAEMATIDIEDFIVWKPLYEMKDVGGEAIKQPILDEDGDHKHAWHIDLWQAKKRGALKYITGFKYTRSGIEPQIIDKESALYAYLKARGLDKPSGLEKPDVSVHMTVEEWKREAERRREEAEETMQKYLSGPDEIEDEL